MAGAERTAATPAANSPALGGPSGGIARLEIDLDAVAANWRHLGDIHGAPTAAVVKADGYGLGARPVAARLYRAGCRHFFVASAAEAERVLAAAPDAMVACLNGLAGDAASDIAGLGAVPVLNSLVDVATWSALARRRDHVLPALLHIDTGMHRLGLPARDVTALAEDPTRLAGIGLRYVMTHLAAAEDPADGSAAAQLARFAAARAMLPAAPASVANSSGIFLKDARSDLARPGAALYGLNPTPGAANPMRPVVRLTAKVLQLRDIEAGVAVGYNGTWTAQRHSRIATVGVGYADGMPRTLSNRAMAFFDGEAIPLVGRVSMDLMTFDATDHPRLQQGDWLELIGPHAPPDEVAARAGTIGYEILTALGARYNRAYLEA
jgi:alanine racemase